MSNKGENSGTAVNEDSGSGIEQSRLDNNEGSRGRRQPRSDGSRVSTENEDSRTASGEDSRQSDVERLKSNVAWSSSNDGERIEGSRRRDSERSSHNVGVLKSGVDEASRTDTASRGHNRSRLPCCNWSELKDGRGFRSRDCKLSELNVMTGEGWDPRATSNGNLELEVQLPSSEENKV